MNLYNPVFLLYSSYIFIKENQVDYYLQCYLILHIKLDNSLKLGWIKKCKLKIVNSIIYYNLLILFN